MLKVVPITLREAGRFVENFHRHNKPPQGGRWAIGASDGARLVGVAIVGRPVARLLQDGETAEIIRLCTNDDAPKNACSMLYGRCWRIWQMMGGTRMVTYTLQAESGASLRGAGWKLIGPAGADGDRKGWQNRPGRDWQPVYGQDKFRWEAGSPHRTNRDKETNT